MQYTPPFCAPRSAPTVRDRANERSRDASHRERRSRRRQRAARSPFARLDVFRARTARNSVKRLRFVKVFLTPATIVSKPSMRPPIRAARIRLHSASHARLRTPTSAPRPPIRAARIRPRSAPHASVRRAPTNPRCADTTPLGSVWLRTPASAARHQSALRGYELRSAPRAWSCSALPEVSGSARRSAQHCTRRSAGSSPRRRSLEFRLREHVVAWCPEAPIRAVWRRPGPSPLAGASSLSASRASAEGPRLTRLFAPGVSPAVAEGLRHRTSRPLELWRTPALRRRDRGRRPSAQRAPPSEPARGASPLSRARSPDWADWKVLTHCDPTLLPTARRAPRKTIRFSPRWPAQTVAGWLLVTSASPRRRAEIRS